MKSQFLFYSLLFTSGIIPSTVLAQDCNTQAITPTNACIIPEPNGNTYIMVYRLPLVTECVMTRGAVTSNWGFPSYIQSFSLETGAAADRPYQLVENDVAGQNYTITTSDPGPAVFVCVKNIGKNAAGQIVSQIWTDFAGSPVSTTYTVGSLPSQINGQLCSNKNIPGSLGDPSWTYDDYALAFFGTDMATQSNGGFPLPVRLVSFGGRKESGNIVLSWKTASEVDLKNFEVQRSTNGSDYTTIGIVASAGYISSEKTYTFTDPSVNFSNTFYYRLKVNDIDARFQYSNIYFVRLNGQISSQTLYPNLIRSGQSATIAISSDKKQRATVAVYNAVGALMGASNIQLENGTQTYNVPSSARLSVGQYVVVIKTELDEQTSHKLIVQ